RAQRRPLAAPRHVDLGRECRRGAGVDAERVVGVAARIAELRGQRRLTLQPLPDHLVLGVVAAVLQQQQSLLRRATALRHQGAGTGQALVEILVATDRTGIAAGGATSALTRLLAVAELAVAARRAVADEAIGRTGLGA